MKQNFYYFISNADNQIHRTDESDLKCQIDKNQKNFVSIQIFGEKISNDFYEGYEVIDEVVGYYSLGDLMESMNGGNDLE